MVRRGDPDDLPTCTEVWLATIDPALVAPAPIYPLYRHQLDTGTLVVAERDGRIVGFGGTITRDSRWYLSDLFVDPRVHGAGIGRRLVDELVAIDQPGPQRVTLSSSDHRALSLYTRLGMVPRWPIFTLLARQPLLDGADTALTVEPLDPEALSALATGWGHRVDRLDMGYWATVLGCDTVAVADRLGRPMAVAVVRHGNRFVLDAPHAHSVGPVVLAPSPPGSDPAANLQVGADVMTALVAWVRRPAPAGAVPGPAAPPSQSGSEPPVQLEPPPVRAHVPGPHGALRPLLEAGFEITDFDLYSSTDPRIIDPLRVCLSGDLL